MTDQERGSDRLGRRAKRFLSPLQKYEIWLQLVRGETTISQAADQWEVDRSTIMRLREVAKQGALAALAESRPGTRSKEHDLELTQAKAEAARLGRRSRRWPSWWQPAARAAGLGGRRDHRAVPPVGRDRPVPPQARPPRLLPGTRLGVAIVGAAGAGRRGPAAAAAAAAWPLDPQAVPRLGGVSAQLDLDLRHHPLH